jgi:tetratricopeptide (TPR) repeat protein
MESNSGLNEEAAAATSTTATLEMKLSQSTMSDANNNDNKKEIDLKKAEEYKEDGNKAFKEQNYAKSIEFYSLAIENNPNEASYYGNRSFAYIKSEFYGIFCRLAPTFIGSIYPSFYLRLCSE